MNNLNPTKLFRGNPQLWVARSGLVAVFLLAIALTGQIHGARPFSEAFNGEPNDGPGKRPTIAADSVFREELPTLQSDCDFSGQKLYTLTGYVFDKSDKLVDSVKVTVTEPSKGYRCTVYKRGKFKIRLPRGTYNFEIRDLRGRFNRYSGLVVNSNTSINFMFAGRARTVSPGLKGKITASPATINSGGTSTLSWSIEGAESVTITPGIGSVGDSGSVDVSPSETTTYVLTASGSGRTTRRTVTVTQTGLPASLPTASINVTPPNPKKGQEVTLTWETSGADSVRITPGVGTVGASGSLTLQVERSGTYEIVATNALGSTSQSFRMSVNNGGNRNGGDKKKNGGDQIAVVIDPITDDPEAEPSPDVEQTATPVTGSRERMTPTQTSTPGGGGNGGGGGIPKWLLYTLLALGGLTALGFGVAALAPAAVPWAAGALGGLGLAGTTSVGDDVHCTLYSEPEVSAGNDLLVQVFAHLEEQADELLELAQELDPDAQKSMSKALKKKVKRESVLTFKLMVPGIDLDEDEQEILWQGEPDSVEFIIPIPPEHDAGKRFGRVFVYNNGEEIGKIPFRINILPRALQLEPSSVAPRVGGVMTDNETAFVSYASRDKDKVYRFVQLMDVLKYKYHIDIFHIDAGDRWEQKLYEFIGKDDVFLLFWSEAASQSEWVLKEAKLAKERMEKDELPRIIIYKLDGKTNVPDWLGDIHVDRKWAEIIGSIENAQEE
ncbi:MAG: toll/interleukin-1 receptor domain-containing protein [Pyrinomonadaceae bacterium]|nr:toll/interleukin-1 receptor domain-containing protein [Pyrinomonadaceae bacterium]